MNFASVEVLPEFIGGDKAFGSFIGKNIRYPEAARKENISGRVFVSFVVQKNGTLTDIKVLRGLGYGLDEEAVRVISMSPNWKPGTQNGSPVQVKYTIPIMFRLNKDESLKASATVPQPKALYLVDGKKISTKKVRSLDPSLIAAVNVLKDSYAVTKYGARGKNGVIEILTKNQGFGKSESIMPVAGFN